MFKHTDCRSGNFFEVIQFLSINFVKSFNFCLLKLVKSFNFYPLNFYAYFSLRGCGNTSDNYNASIHAVLALQD